MVGVSQRFVLAEPLDISDFSKFTAKPSSERNSTNTAYEVNDIHNVQV